MKICKECGQSVPEDATECPYCGAEITNGKRIASILVGVMLAVGAVAAYFAYNSHQVALQQEREQAIRDSLAHLDAIMRAPEIDLDSTGGLSATTDWKWS